MNIAICIIAYNRIDSLKRVLKSLEQAYYDEPITLFISVDKSETNSVEMFAEQYIWKFGTKKVITHSANLGLRKHVLKCGDLLELYDALIILEDDVSVAPSFYYYAKQCVEKYVDNRNIAGISLYNFPINYQNLLPFNPLHSDSDIYLMQCAQSWGQVWMKKQWFKFKEWYELHSEDFDESLHLPRAISNWPKSSWLKYHIKYCIENKKYFVYPYISLSTNNADIGTHYTNKTTIFQTPLFYGLKTSFNLEPEVLYDGFFENENLCELLGYNIDELCVDFYGEKGNRLKKKYWLTRKILPFKIIKSYALSFKPYELNVIQNNIGNDLFLYDTSVKEKNGKVRNLERNFYEYLYYIDFYSFQQLKKQVKIFVKRFIKC